MVHWTWSSRAAANSIASTSGPNGFAAPDNNTWRMISAPGEPPGSRVSCTPMPRASSRSASIAAWVDLPVPSPPSKVMNLPYICATFSSSLSQPQKSHLLYIKTFLFNGLRLLVNTEDEMTPRQELTLMYWRPQPHLAAGDNVTLQATHAGADQADHQFCRAIDRAP